MAGAVGGGGSARNGLAGGRSLMLVLLYALCFMSLDAEMLGGMNGFVLCLSYFFSCRAGQDKV